MKDGIVKWFNEAKGFGFIQSQGVEYFVHFKEIQSPGFKTLKEGDIVSFEAGKSEKGLLAKQVTKQVAQSPY